MSKKITVKTISIDKYKKRLVASVTKKNYKKNTLNGLTY